MRFHAAVSVRSAVAFVAPDRESRPDTGSTQIVRTDVVAAVVVVAAEDAGTMPATTTARTASHTSSTERAALMTCPFRRPSSGLPSAVSTTA